MTAPAAARVLVVCTANICRSPAAEGVLSAGLSRVEVVTPAALGARYGRAAPDGGGRRQFMAALHLRTLSLGRVDTALAAGGVAHARADGAVTVAADDAGGVTLVFGE